MRSMQSASVAQVETSAAERASNGTLIEAIRAYWNEHIHDLEIARHPVGTRGFFQELDAYRFEKLDYLPRVVDFTAYRGKKLLEVGCGIGLDLVRFARQGTIVTGVDLAQVSIELAKKNFRFHGLAGDLRVMNGEYLEFADDSFDVVYAHGVLQYTADIRRMLAEIKRVVKPGGHAILMVYNRYSWLNALSKITRVKLEHEDAPVLSRYSILEFHKLLAGFSHVEIIPERFPVPTRLHRGIKGAIYNGLFVSIFNRLPKTLVGPLGWHLIANATK